ASLVEPNPVLGEAILRAASLFFASDASLAEPNRAYTRFVERRPGACRRDVLVKLSPTGSMEHE
ncbi:MAG: hypothetical protein ACE5Q3_16185, partial [Alphaproteobacteria bacterium]